MHFRFNPIGYEIIGPMCRVEIAAPLTKIHLPIGRPNLGIPSDALTGSATSA